MTSPIKPPGGAPPSRGIPSPDATNPKVASESQEVSFQETLGASDAKGTAEVTTDALLADVKAGRIDANAAVERLVAEALEGPLAAGLTPAGKADLEAHLRDALQHDPNLAAMVRDLERGA